LLYACTGRQFLAADGIREIAREGFGDTFLVPSSQHNTLSQHESMNRVNDDGWVEVIVGAVMRGPLVATPNVVFSRIMA
jgi:hypothetical protein